MGLSQKRRERMADQPFKHFASLLLSFGLLLPACSHKAAPPPPPQAAISTPTPATQAPAPQVQAPPAAAPAVEYEMEDLKGKVSVIPAGSTQAEPAEEEETIEEGDEVVTGNASQASLALNELTMVHLSENSHLKVSGLSANDSNGFVTRLKLLTGRVLAEVQSLTESKSSFEVESGGVVCGVRGTAFEMQKQGEVVHTSTFHGAVEVQHHAQTQLVQAGEHSASPFNRPPFPPKRPLNTA